MTKKIKQRTVYFIAVEGESERGFIAWIQELCDAQGLHIHLDCIVLNGGGYEVILNEAINHQKHQKLIKNEPASSILLVDADRAVLNNDPLTLEQFKQKAQKMNFTVCFLNPNLEGVFLRMLSKNHTIKIALIGTERQLRKKWPNYNKPADKYELRSKFTLDDLCRVSENDLELSLLLKMIGLSKDYL